MSQHSLSPHSQQLADTLAAGLPAERIANLLGQIHSGLVASSRHIREANFRTIHPDDLQWLFERYNAWFFQGAIGTALNGSPLRFRLAPRMSKAGGKTTTYRNRAGERSYEIAIASSILFDGFKDDHRSVTACGIECQDRLAALQRIFEHELVHLAEFLAWGSSNCSAPRFQLIARDFFNHQSHTHALITRRERAAASGIGIGSRVTFMYEGQRFTGKVNRITKRATVLVEHPAGRPFSDGLRYHTYYVPLNWLEPVISSGARALAVGAP